MDDENYDLCTSCNNIYHLTCMETNNDHKTCYSCKSYIDELENQNESEVKQPELDEHTTILKETSITTIDVLMQYKHKVKII